MSNKRHGLSDMKNFPNASASFYCIVCKGGNKLIAYLIFCLKIQADSSRHHRPVLALQAAGDRGLY